LVLIFIASISDLLDGYIARRKNLISEFGKIIDPLADKVCVILIITQLYLLGEIISIYFWIIVGRDVIIFIGGIIVSKKIGKVLPSNLLGKITVITIGIFIIITVIDLSKTNFLYHFFFYLSIIMSVLSVFGYGLRALEVLRWNKNETI
jgi:CDP-diacylglycerol--glycerol-3-phosphate 3-phosphatidyltransferase